MKCPILHRYVYQCFCLALLFGTTTAIAANLPSGFAEVLVAQDLDPTAMALAPDGRIFLTEKSGRVLIVDNGQLLPDPFLLLDVDNYNERGLSGIAFHPDFAQNGFVYLYYTVKGQGHNRVSRFTANGNYALPGSEVIILDLDPLNGTIHNAGAMLFGEDGKLYISVGDGANGEASQSFTSLLGKILRINDDGSIPEDNPFYQQNEGKYRSIYALGLRNSFSMAMQPVTGRLFATEVGAGTWEEINHILPGKNYGWSIIEGPISGQTPPENYMDPIHRYTRAGGCAIVGAAFYNPAVQMFPEVYKGKFFFADYCNGYIKFINPEAPTNAVTFANNINRPLNILVAQDGTMYYLARAGLGGGSEEDNTATNNGTLWRVFYTGSGAPFVSVNPQSVLVSEGEDAVFTMAASGIQPLLYRWQKDGNEIPGATEAILVYEDVLLSDDGSAFRCIVTNSDGSDTTTVAILNVTTSQRPSPEILTPTDGTQYRAGETIFFSGMATDNEDGDLDAESLQWKIDFHHDTHTHPGLVPTSGISEGSFFIPQTGETSDNVWYTILLTATDASGLSRTVTRDVYPVKTVFHVTSEPEGLPVYIESDYLQTPVSETSVVGIARRIEVLGSIMDGDSILVFRQWSDGVFDMARTFAAEEDTITYVAIYEKYALGKGTGIRGYFYDSPPYDATFYEPYNFTWIDTTINFDWGASSPAPTQLGDDHWLVRWNGFIQPLFGDTYDFYVIADDGIRLWVDSQLIIDAWIPQPPTEWSGTIDLEGGKQYPIQLEFFEEGGGAICQLSWSSRKLSRNIVPRSQLYVEMTSASQPDPVVPVKLYPNPVQDILKLDIPEHLYGEVSIEIRNMLGQKLSGDNHHIHDPLFEMDVRWLPKGLYWFQYKTDNGESATIGFMKM